MIKAQELRIGNLVFRLGEVSTVNSISVDSKLGYVSTSLSGIITENQINPIPLTEEWLLKFGFEKRENYKGNKMMKHFYLNELYVLPIIQKQQVVYECYFGESSKEIFIQYVHQLQNLFLALTREELTTK